MTGITFPLLSAHDPNLDSTEGALDPLGLYVIADNLALRLVALTWEQEQNLHGFVSGQPGRGVRFRNQLIDAIRDGLAAGVLTRKPRVGRLVGDW